MKDRENNSTQPNGAPNGAHASGGGPAGGPDDVQRLLAGYATGALSEAERQQLFAAALEDQELFEALSDEHALKELIELPGARERLVRALEPEEARGGAGVREDPTARVRGWRGLLSPWAQVAGVVTAMGVLTLILLRPESEPTAKVAQSDAKFGEPQAQNIQVPTSGSESASPRASSADVANDAKDNEAPAVPRTPVRARQFESAQPEKRANAAVLPESAAAAPPVPAPQPRLDGVPPPVIRDLNRAPENNLPILAIGSTNGPPPAAAQMTAGRTAASSPQAPTPATAANQLPPPGAQVRAELRGQEKGADAVEEIAVQTANFAAEFGQAGAAITPPAPPQAAAAKSGANPGPPPQAPALADRSTAESITVTAETTLLKTETPEAPKATAVPTLQPPPATPAKTADASALAPGKGKGAAKGGAAPAGFAAAPTGALNRQAAGGAGPGVAGALAAPVNAGPFNYQFLAGPRLRVVPATAGVLLVKAGDFGMFPANPVVAGTPIELAIPENVRVLQIEFRREGVAPVIANPQVPGR